LPRKVLVSLLGIQNRLERQKGQGSLQQLEEYRNGIFWGSTKSPIFMLEEDSSKPSRLWILRDILWLPYQLHKDLNCPAYHEKIEVKGLKKIKSATHCQSQWVCISTTVLETKYNRHYNVLSAFYLITWRYRCKNKSKLEHHTFNGYHQGIIKWLPLIIQTNFPAVLTHRSGISKLLAHITRPLF
jgi:hypothetical protein